MENALNVNEPERWIAVVGGAALAAYGLTRRSPGGLLLAGLGGFFIWRGLASTPTQGENVSVPYGRGIRVEESVFIVRSPEELYRFWRNFENLPRIMSHVESVQVLSETRSRWRVEAPAGMTSEWEAEIINDRPPQLIAWRTLPGALVAHAGSVQFTPTAGGTRIAVSLQYDPPGGTLTHAVAALMDADAGRRIEHDLREFKQALETGRLAA